jgi:hypothetical protein
MEQKLAFRGVNFTVKLEGRGYRWTIQPVGTVDGQPAAQGQTMGQSAFRQAVMQAHAAIDAWLEAQGAAPDGDRLTGSGG